ncbi:MAG: gliding motility-associated C-terminal domain-containing protein [Chitinophagales bacterium]
MLYTRLIYTLLITLGITFSSTLRAQFQAIGNASSLGDNCYQLTGAFNTQFGAIWSNDLINLNESFEAQFRLYLGDKDANGADGIVFVFQPVSNTVGSLGGGLGFEGIVPSVGVEFDTWQNGDRLDPPNDHVCLMQHGNLHHVTGALTPATSLGNIEDGQWHDVRVTWNAEIHQLKVFWQCTSILTYNGDIVNNTFSGNPMVYWGFTSATGAANNVHQVCIDYISFLDDLPNQEICDGESTLIGGLPNPDYTYSWTPTNTLNNPNISNPLATPTETTSYILEITDECLFSFYDTVEVVVKPAPDVEFWEDNLQACVGEVIVLDATTPDAEAYHWNNNASTPTLNVTQTGFYTVEVTVGGCSDLEGVFVDFFPLPFVNLGPDINVCGSEEVVLNATTNNMTYQWQNGATTPMINVSNEGIYTVTITSTVSGCTATDAIAVSFLPPPIFDLGADQTLCEGESATFDATIANGLYEWQDGSTSAILEVSQSGTYTVTVTDADTNCSATDEVSVTVNPLPQFDLGEDVTLCEGETAVLDASIEGGLYQWTNGLTTSTITVTSTDTYTVVVSFDTGCSATDLVTVVFNPLPTPDLGPDQTFCEGGTVTLIAPNADSYQWQDGSSLPVLQVSEEGTYAVTVTIDGCKGSDEINVELSPMLTFDLAEAPPLCEGETYTITAPESDVYEWQDGSTNPSFEVTEAGTYSVTITQDGCKGADDVIVFFNPLPTFSLEEVAPLCEGETFTLTAPESDAYEWQDGSTNPSFEVTEAGTYSVTITQSGCTSSDDVTISFNPPLVFDLGEPPTLCDGESYTITAPESDAYEWQDGSTNPIFEVTEAGTYSVTITQNGCTGSDDIEISFNELPIVDLGEDISLCEGQSITLDATPENVADATFLWSDNSTGSNIEVSAEGTYSVTVTSGNCSSSDEVTVSFNANPTINLGNDQTLCEGETLVLDATVGGATYEWQDGSTNPTFEVTEAGTYSVTVDLEGCILEGSITIDFNPLPAIDLGEDQTICENETVTLNATTPNATYEWQDGSTNPTFEATEEGIYLVEITVNGCTAMDEIGVTQIILPPIDLGEDVSACEGETLQIGVDGVFPAIVIFGWQDNTSGQYYEVTESGTYTLTASINQCMVTDEITVSFNEIPIVDLGAGLSICEGETTILDATHVDASATYLWNTNATTPMIDVQASGTYSVTVTVNDCSSSDAIEVIVNELPQMDLGEDLTFCEGESFTLDATPSNVTGATYEWQDGSNAATFEAVVSGIYSVTVTANGCGIMDEITLTFNALPDVDLGNDLTLCDGEVLQLDATVADAGAVYEWQDGSANPTFEVTEAGTYSVTVTVNGCSSSDEINVNFDELGIIDLGADATLCEGESLVLDATTPNATYVWQDDSTNPTFEVIEAGTYSVIVSVGACTLQGSIEVVYNPLPTVDLGENQRICEGESVVLDATTANATYEWQDGSTDPTFETSDAGIYSVTIDVNGCTATDFIEVERIELPSIDLGEDQTLCEGLILGLNISGNYPDAIFEWQDGTLGQEYLISEAGTYSVSVSIGDCMVSEELTVTFNEVPSLTLEDVTLCEGETRTLTPFAGDSGTAVYQWSNGLTDASIEVGESGVYAVTVMDNGCTSMTEAEVIFDAAPIIDLGQDTTLCVGESLVLEAPAADTYLWQDGSVNASLEVTESGLYSVEARAGTCVLTGEIRVDFAAVPTVDLGDDVLLCEGEGVVLQPQVTNGVFFEWQDGSNGVELAVIEAGEYSLEVRGDLDRCMASDAVLVEYEVCDFETFGITVVNAFSPNGDGVNDEFRVWATEQPDEFYCAIFNRWGQKVFETTDINGTWDGVFKNQLEPIGVYAFYAEAWKVVNGERERFWKQGNVTLVR